MIDKNDHLQYKQVGKDCSFWPDRHIKITTKIEGYDPVEFSIDPNVKDRPTVFALSIRKSGSSVFNNIISAIARSNEINVVDIPDAAFRKGIPYTAWNKPEVLNPLVWRGNAYVGFRDAPSSLFEDPVFRRSKKILLLRDPRDILVSEYFSNAYSHSLPEGDQGDSVISKERKLAQTINIEKYVLGRTGSLNATVRSYRPLIKRNQVKILRYEDVIFDKKSWMREICETFDFDINDQLMSDILGWADIRPATEQPKEFVRRVTPGDYLEKLSPDVISKLEQNLDELWWDLGYIRMAK